MDSLDHLKTRYRPRFFNIEGKKEVIDIQGDNVLGCLQDCFETCAKEFTECSPSISCGSSPSLDHVPCHSKEKQQTMLELAKVNCANSVFNSFNFLLPAGKIKRFSDSSKSEEILDEDIDVVSLGSPALLVEEGKEAAETEEEEEEKSCVERLCFDEEAFDLQNSKIEEPTSSQIKMSGSLSTLEAMASPLTIRKAANVELEEECEFLIEESFGACSVSWISKSQNKQNPWKKRLKSVSFEENKEAQQHNKRRKDEQELGKMIMPTPVKQIKAPLCNGEITFDGLQTTSRTNKVMAVENDHLQLVINTPKPRKQKHSKSEDVDSIEMHNRVYQDSISRKEARGPVPLPEPDQRLSVQIQHVESSEESSSQNTLTTPTEVHNENQQKCTVSVLSSKDCTQSKNINIYSENVASVPRPVPVAQQLCQSKPVRKQKLPSPKQFCIQEKKSSSVGFVRRKKRQLVSKRSLEGDKKDESHPLELRRSLRRTASQKVKQTALIKSKDNIYQEDSFEQQVAQKSLKASVRQQNSDGFLLHGPVSSNKKFTREWNPHGTDGSDSVLPTNTPNVRRTKRIRVKPLEYWRGERVEYKSRASGGFVIGGIVSPEQREPWKPKPKVTEKPIPENESMPDDSFFLKELSEPAIVFDKASNQEILLKCVNNGSSQLFFINNEALSIYKFLSTPTFSAGKIILKPFKEKGYQYSHTDTLVFHVHCGKLLLTMYDQNYCLTAGNYFFIPPGNVYNIRNLLHKECVILFTQLKGKDQLENHHLL